MFFGRAFGKRVGRLRECCCSNYSYYIYKVFKIKNRIGFAALCQEHLTEGTSKQQAYDRMVKAINRTFNKAAKK